jgi:outer membrane protein TolC
MQLNGLKKTNKKHMKKIVLLLATVLTTCLFSFGQEKETFTLERVLKIAEDNSPSLKQTKLRLVQSEENLKAQNAGLKSQFSLNLDPFSYQKNRNFDKRTSTWYSNETKSSAGTFTVSQPVKFTDGTISLNNRLSYQNSTTGELNNETFSNKLYLSIEQPLFTYNRTKMALKELEWSFENSKINYAIQQLNIEKAVTQQFYSVYQAQKNLTIAKDEFKNQEANYSLVKDKVEAGLLKREELFQAEVNFASSRSDLYNKEVELENVKDNFKQALGIDLDRNFLILADVSANKINVEMKAAINYGLMQRMELRQKEISMERALFDLIKTKANNEFKGSISASFGLLGQNKSANRMFDNPEDDQAVSIKLSIPVWDWGAKRARVKASKAAIESTEIDGVEEKKTIEISIRKICRNLPNLLTQIDIAKQNETNSERTYDLNLEKYKTGNLTGMELQQFQNQLTQKKQALTNALISYKLEVLNLKIQTLWDFEKNASYLPVNLLK